MSATGVTADPGLADHADAGQAAANTPVAPNALTLRLIATTDLHASLLPYDYHANRPVADRSLCTLSH